MMAGAGALQVEARTRKDIEEKKEELRQLVGASYRDLIESADSILAMRRQGHCLCLLAPGSRDSTPWIPACFVSTPGPSSGHPRFRSQAPA